MTLDDYKVVDVSLSRGAFNTNSVWEFDQIELENGAGDQIVLYPSFKMDLRDTNLLSEGTNGRVLTTSRFREVFDGLDNSINNKYLYCSDNNLDKNEIEHYFVKEFNWDNVFNAMEDKDQLFVKSLVHSERYADIAREAFLKAAATNMDAEEDLIFELMDDLEEELCGLDPEYYCLTLPEISDYYLDQLDSEPDLSHINLEIEQEVFHAIEKNFTTKEVLISKQEKVQSFNQLVEKLQSQNKEQEVELSL